MPRDFSPYELTQLVRANIDPHSITENDTRPVEYITGVVEFCGLNFKVNPDALIPRIETEWLVEKGLAIIKDLIKNGHQTISVLDIGTGSGAIIISLVHKLNLNNDKTKFEFVATEISRSALNIAKINSKNILGDNSKIKFVVSDLFEQISDEKPFDLIIANLPYIPKSRIAYLDSSVKDHEPYVALDGGDSGFELIEKMLNDAVGFIEMNGLVILEIDHTHTGEIWQNVAKKWQIDLELDEFTRNRFAVLKTKADTQLHPQASA